MLVHLFIFFLLIIRIRITMRGPLNVKLRTVSKQRKDSFERMKSTHRRLMIIIHLFYCICAFCWYIKELITVR
jgi:hypothetical protein